MFHNENYKLALKKKKKKEQQRTEHIQEEINETMKYYMKRKKGKEYYLCIVRAKWEHGARLLQTKQCSLSNVVSITTAKRYSGTHFMKVC